MLRQVPAIVHSRIAGLRDQGYVIEHKTTGQGAQHSLYRLVVAPTAGGPQEVSPAVGGAPSSSPSSPGASPQEATPPLPQAGPEPLTLFGDQRTHYAKDAA